MSEAIVSVPASRLGNDHTEVVPVHGEVELTGGGRGVRVRRGRASLEGRGGGGGVTRRTRGGGVRYVGITSVLLNIQLHLVRWRSWRH